MRLILIFSISICQFITAQFKVDTISRTIEFDKVYPVEKISSDNIRNKVNEWIALRFNSSKEVVKLDSPEKIIVKGNFPVAFGERPYIKEYPCYFDMITSLKNEKYKLEINNLRIEIPNKTIYVKDYVLGSKEDYKNIIKEKLKDVENKADINFYNKLLSKESKLEKQYESIKKVTDKTVAQLKTNIESIAEELFEYVNKESNKDW